MDKVNLLSLATALPPYTVEQAVAKAKARELFGGRKALFDRLSGVFDNAGIARRHTVAPIEWYEGHHGWKERNRVYLDACDALFREAATKAIEQCRPQAVGHRRRRGGFDYRDRHAQPRCAQWPRNRPQKRRPPRTRVRHGLRGRGQRACYGCAACRQRTRQQLAVRHHRDLLDRHPARQRRSGRDRRDGDLRRRSSGSGRRNGRNRVSPPSRARARRCGRIR